MSSKVVFPSAPILVNWASRIITTINTLNHWIGQIMSLLTLAVVLICFTIVVMRYLFQTSYVWMQDLYVWLHAVAFTLGAGYTLLYNGHVRVDVIYSSRGRQYRAWIDILGSVFFIWPFVLVVTTYAFPYIERSWWLLERSVNVGGLQGFYLLKSCLLGFAWLIGLQSVSTSLSSILVLTGNHPPKFIKQAYKSKLDL